MSILYHIRVFRFNSDFLTAKITNEGGGDGYYAVLVLNDAGDMASYYAVDAINGTTGASSPTDRTVNMTWSGSEYLTLGGYTVAVPEPTSGLLMLVGLAGLALRRRRA